MTAVHPNRPRRSALYMPASNAKAVEKARTLDADVIILDLEDAVAPESKPAAREAAVAAVKAGGFGAREVVIRVNGIDTPWGAEDLAAAAEAGPDAVLGDLITHLNEVTAIVAAQSTNTQDLIRHSRNVMVALSERRGELVDSVGSIGSATTQLARVLDGMYADLDAIITREPGTPAGSIGKGFPGVAVYNSQTLTECPRAKFDENGALKDAKQQAAVDAVVASLIRVATALKSA